MSSSSKTYDTYHDQPNLNDKVDEVIQSIRDIAEIQGFNTEVAKEAARLLSVWGRRNITPALPRGKKHRWDCIHLATAHLLQAKRVYAWDDPWTTFPKTEISKIGEIISPAVAPVTSMQPSLLTESV